MLPLADFKNLVQNGILVSIDLIIYNEDNEVLVGLRTNRPAQNYWFVPGGRIYKNESIENGFGRITQLELGTGLRYQEAKFLGVYQHLYPDNFSGDGFGTHYVVLAHELVVMKSLIHKPGDDQHTTYRWITIPDLLSAADVHPYTKNYFRIERHPSLTEGVVTYHPYDQTW